MRHRYVPAVLADVVEVSQLAVSHLFGVVLEQRHPPHPVTCHNTSLQTRTHTHVNRRADELRHRVLTCICSTLCSCSQSQSEFVKTPAAAEPSATSIAPWRQNTPRFWHLSMINVLQHKENLMSPCKQTAKEILPVSVATLTMALGLKTCP